MYRIFLLLLVAMGLSPEFAQAANVFQPVAGDKFMVLISQMFGGLVTATGGAGGGDPMMALISSFNGAMMTIGGMLAAYTILASTIGTAHDGEWMGKKFHAAWVPIRYTLGTALVLPVVGAGYCTMQLLVMWLVTQGVGLADMSWSAYTSTQNLVSEQSVSMPNAQVTNFIYTMYQTQVCMQSIALDASTAAGKTIATGVNMGTTTVTGINSDIIYYGDKSEAGDLKQDSCGKIEISHIPLDTSEPNTNPISAAFNGPDAAAQMATIYNEHINQMNIAMTALQPLAATLIKTHQPTDSRQLDAIVAAYQAGVAAKVNSVVAGLQPTQNLSQNASKDGFINAGAFFMPMVSMQGMVNTAVSAVPTASGPQSVDTEMFADTYGAVLPALQKTMQSGGSSVTFGVAQEAQGTATNGLASTFKNLTSSFDATATLKNKFASQPFKMNVSDNAMLTMTNLGGWLLGVSSAGWAGCMLLMSTFGNAPGIGLALASTMMLILPAMLAVGFTLSFVLPMMPYMMWLGAVVGYIFLVIEAILVAPLWAVMHLHPDGHDVTGKGGNGYLLVLSLTLRPVLMIAGLISSLVVIQVLGSYIAMVYASVFTVSQIDSGFLKWVLSYYIAGPSLYAGANYVMVRKSLEAITYIPDQCMRWIGGSGGELGGHAQDVGGDKSTSFVALGGIARMGGDAAGKFAAPKASQPGGNPASQLKDPAPAGMAARNEEKLGAGGEDITSAAQAQHGGADANSLGVQKTLQAVNAAQGVVGGKDSVAGNVFKDKLMDNHAKNPGGKLEDSIPSALNAAMNHNYGTGAGQMAARVAGNGTASPDSYKGAKYAGAAALYKNTADRLERKNGMAPADVRSTISSATRAADQEFTADKNSTLNGGTRGLEDYVTSHLENAGRPPKAVEPGPSPSAFVGPQMPAKAAESTPVPPVTKTE